MRNVRVSILCLTYNQKKYVGQCLDSLLAQKTDFNFEILINDDASSDGTKEIIEEYQKSHPNVIKPVFQKENQYSKGIRNFIPRYLLPNVNGNYIAICEGDDFWTDRNKLQKQVDFLEKNKDYALCFHPVTVHFENNEEPDEVFPKAKDPKYFIVKNLVKQNFIQTNSVMYRRQDYTNIATDVFPGDWYLHLYHAQFGRIGFINDEMSVYRRHNNGLWWNSYSDIDRIWIRHGFEHLNLFRELLTIYGSNNELKESIIKNIYKMINNIALSDVKYDENAMEKVSKKYSEYISKLIKNNNDTILDKIETNNLLSEKVKQLTEELRDIKYSYQKQLEKNIEISNSRIWKTRNKIAPILKKDKI